MGEAYATIMKTNAGRIRKYQDAFNLKIDL